jgi:hypothetical protein
MWIMSDNTGPYIGTQTGTNLTFAIGGNDYIADLSTAGITTRGSKGLYSARHGRTSTNYFAFDAAGLPIFVQGTTTQRVTLGSYP